MILPLFLTAHLDNVHAVSTERREEGLTCSSQANYLLSGFVDTISDDLLLTFFSDGVSEGQFKHVLEQGRVSSSYSKANTYESTSQNFLNLKVRISLFIPLCNNTSPAFRGMQGLEHESLNYNHCCWVSAKMFDWAQTQSSLVTQETTSHQNVPSNEHDGDRSGNCPAVDSS
jgi:hypothetical protein